MPAFCLLGMVIPMGPQSIQPSTGQGHQSLHGIHIKPVGGKPTIQVKQEGGKLTNQNFFLKSEKVFRE